MMTEFSFLAHFYFFTGLCDEVSWFRHVHEWKTHPVLLYTNNKRIHQWALMFWKSEDTIYKCRRLQWWWWRNLIILGLGDQVLVWLTVWFVFMEKWKWNSKSEFLQWCLKHFSPCLMNNTPMRYVRHNSVSFSSLQTCGTESINL